MWPWCPPHSLQWYSVLGEPIILSTLVSSTPGNDSKKDGQPEPLSYLLFDSNNFTPQAAQKYVPSLF